MQKQRNQAEFLALIALFSGGLCTGSAGLLVRLSETGPVATAFWRGLLALAWGERPRPRFLLAIGLALAGVVLIVSPKLGHGGSSLVGDALGLGTACFYAAYLVAIARLRERYRTGMVLFRTTIVFTVLLLPLALTQKFLPDTLAGWAILAGCAVAAQFLGQGLIAYALAHLPATFGSVGLYVTSIAAAVCARIVLNERLAPVQIVGGCVVLAAIALARTARASPEPAAAHAPRAAVQPSTARESE